MRLLGFLGPALLLLSSCGPSATLFTDDVFRASAPELVQAWTSLGPWKAIRVIALPPGQTFVALQNALKGHVTPETILVGVGLQAQERLTLVRSSPQIRFIFFVPVSQAGGETTVSLDRAGAWALVATEVAKAGKKTAAVLYPEDATSLEIRRFSEAWTAAGGGPLTSRPGNSKSPWDPVPAQVFQWYGPGADPSVLLLPASVLVHGDPGTAMVPGAQGLSWTIRETNLGPWLWNLVVDGQRKTHFLPLETVLVRR